MDYTKLLNWLWKSITSKPIATSLALSVMLNVALMSYHNSRVEKADENQRKCEEEKVDCQERVETLRRVFDKEREIYWHDNNKQRDSAWAKVGRLEAEIQRLQNERHDGKH